MIIRVVSDRSIGANLLLGKLWLRWFSVVSLLYLALFDRLLHLDGRALISLVILTNYLALVMIMSLVLMVPSRILNYLLILVVEIDFFHARIIQNFLLNFTRILLILSLNVFIQKIIIIFLFELFSV